MADRSHRRIQLPGEHRPGSRSRNDLGRSRPRLLSAFDRTALVVLDPATRTVVVVKAVLASSPDYVRWVEPTGEIRVTQPGKNPPESAGQLEAIAHTGLG
ncbi:MAG: hypothetical protein M3O15_12590 [Acidobacteriota bacterium]|nr:hypothetical protein [Acidobacteriota bacterium]